MPDVGLFCVHCRMLRSHPDLYPSEASGTLPSYAPFLPNASRCYHCPAWERLSEPKEVLSLGYVNGEAVIMRERGRREGGCKKGER